MGLQHAPLHVRVGRLYCRAKGGPMTSISSRVLPVAFISLISACASAPATSIAAAPASPAPTTSKELPPPVRSLEQLLAGRVSGASVTAAPLGGVIVRISGPHS